MKQPKVLSFFFLTEMCERFAFYMLEGLMILYMVHTLHFSDAKSYAIMGEFSALVYIMPALGGWLADYVLGFRIAIILGSVLLAGGYATLAFGPHALLPGLILLALGHGFFKPNILGFLGEFYGENDPRREAGFTFFYMGVSAGFFLSVLSVGLIQQYFGGSAPFIASSLSVLIGLLIFFYGKRYFNHTVGPYPHRNTRLSIFITRPFILPFIAVLGLLLWSLMRYRGFVHHMLEIFSVAALVYMGFLDLIFRLDPKERNRLIALVCLMIFSVLFWALFFELYFSVSLYTDRMIDHTLFGWTVSSSTLLAFQPLFVLLLAPFFAKLLRGLAREPNPWFSLPMKFAYGLLMIALAMQLLVFSLKFQHGNELISPFWLISFYFLLAVGELFLSPIGFSMVTECAPKRHVGFLMGVWFLSLSLGAELASLLAKSVSIPKHMLDLHRIAQTYAHAFQYHALLGLGGFIALLCLAPLLQKLILGIPRISITEKY